MERQAETETDPAKWVLSCVICGMRVIVFAVNMLRRGMCANDIAGIAMLMGMDVKYPNKQKHGQQTTEHPADNTIGGRLMSQSVRH
jgi:hypothetical protein